MNITPSTTVKEILQTFGANHDNLAGRVDALEAVTQQRINVLEAQAARRLELLKEIFASVGLPGWAAKRIREEMESVE
jgi:phosphoribosylaminoimidazole-succinocarboxamide synthase